MDNKDNKSTIFDILIPLSVDVIPQEQQREKQRFPFVLSPQYKPAPSFGVGDVIMERYTVKRHFHGNMGDVYQCYDKCLRSDVALKTLISNKRSDQVRYDFLWKKCNNGFIWSSIQM